MNEVRENTGVARPCMIEQYIAIYNIYTTYILLLPQQRYALGVAWPGRFRNAFRHFVPFGRCIDGSGGWNPPSAGLAQERRLVKTPSLLGMTLRVRLLPVLCSLCLAKLACESGTVCSEEEVEAWEEKKHGIRYVQMVCVCFFCSSIL